MFLRGLKVHHFGLGIFCWRDPTWDEQLITDVFWPKDAEVILMIPTDDESVDWPARHYDPKGVFSVKSAYK